MSTLLNVFMNERQAGELNIDDNMRMSFCYAEDYIAIQGQAISLTLPVVDCTYPDAVVFPFVENLLPEGEIREKIRELHKIEDGNYERLLELLGGDVAGAISFYPVGQKPISNLDPGKALTTDEISQLLLDIQDRPFSSISDGDVGNRLSLAGAQNKLPVIVKGERIFEAGFEPSTHIIKPARKDGRFSSIVYNEYICMKAAKRAGINTSIVSLLTVNDQDGNESDALLIERYDRSIESDQVARRLGQEDLCQLNSIVSTKKYEKSGGPGFVELFEAIRVYSVVPAVDDLEAIKRMVFNLVIGNYDAHGKNFSFITDRQGRVKFSPAYDLVCTEAYDELDKTFAMAIDDIYELSEITEANFQCMFVALGKKYSGLKKFIITFIKASLSAMEAEVVEFIDGDYYQDDIDMANLILAISKDNSRVLLQMLDS